MSIHAQCVYLCFTYKMRKIFFLAFNIFPILGIDFAPLRIHGIRFGIAQVNSSPSKCANVQGSVFSISARQYIPQPPLFSIRPLRAEPALPLQPTSSWGPRSVPGWAPTLFSPLGALNFCNVDLCVISRLPLWATCPLFSKKIRTSSISFISQS